MYIINQNSAQNHQQETQANSASLLDFIAILITIPSFASNLFDDAIKLCHDIYPEYWQIVAISLIWILGTGVVAVSVMAVLYARVIHSLWIQNNGSVTCLAVINATYTGSILMLV